MSGFDDAFAIVVGVEGGLSLDPSDRGNWTGGQVGVGVLKGTKYGISAAAYPRLDIAALTLDDAKDLYRRDYWEACGCDDLAGPLALLLFDEAVNQGQHVAISTLQSVLGVASDGVIGPATTAAIKAADPRRCYAGVLAARCLKYSQASSFATYGRGWFNRIGRVVACSVALPG